MDVPQDQRAEIDWRDGVPISKAFQDPYYSLSDGLAETEHVFLRGNDLPERFEDGFAIGELGFGSGLNALATLNCWREAGTQGRFSFTSFEMFLMDPNDLLQALAPFGFKAEASLLSRELRKGSREIEIGPMDLRIVTGDARQTVPDWADQADAWFLDGFAPARNPEMWEEGLMAAISEKTKEGGSFATYSAASAVRQSLQKAGFSVERRTGFRHKRHMTVGRK